MEKQLQFKLKQNGILMFHKYRVKLWFKFTVN